jgi:hypothetical protein
MYFFSSLIVNFLVNFNFYLLEKYQHFCCIPSTVVLFSNIGFRVQCEPVYSAGFGFVYPSGRFRGFGSGNIAQLMNERTLKELI